MNACTYSGCDRTVFCCFCSCLSSLFFFARYQRARSLGSIACALYAVCWVRERGRPEEAVKMSGFGLWAGGLSFTLSALVDSPSSWPWLSLIYCHINLKRLHRQTNRLGPVRVKSDHRSRRGNGDDNDDDQLSLELLLHARDIFSLVSEILAHLVKFLTRKHLAYYFILPPLISSLFAGKENRTTLTVCERENTNTKENEMKKSSKEDECSCSGNR